MSRLEAKGRRSSIGSWLEAWLSYYQGLYAIGLMMIVAAVLAGILALLIAGVPVALFAMAIGWNMGQTDFLALSALIALPPLLGVLVREMRVERLLPTRPPGWRRWREGALLSGDEAGV